VVEERAPASVSKPRIRAPTGSNPRLVPAASVCPSATSEEVPSVDIHVANEFRESGYLATTLDGKVERAHPYANP